MSQLIRNNSYTKNSARNQVSPQTRFWALFLFFTVEIHINKTGRNNRS